jgi:hypothetical protein
MLAVPRPNHQVVFPADKNAATPSTNAPTATCRWEYWWTRSATTLAAYSINLAIASAGRT